MAFVATLLLSFAGCTQKEIFDLPVEPVPRENSVSIRDSLYTIEQLLWGTTTIEYPDENFEVAGTEDGLSIRIMASGAVVTADMPLDLVGSIIDLSSRDASPDLDGIYYTFYLSVRGRGELYCRIMSWDTSPNPFGGWLSVKAGEGPDMWTVEWELTSSESESDTEGEPEIVSTGYVDGAFEPIRTP